MVLFSNAVLDLKTVAVSFIETKTACLSDLATFTTSADLLRMLFYKLASLLPDTPELLHLLENTLKLWKATDDTLLEQAGTPNSPRNRKHRTNQHSTKHSPDTKYST